MATEWNGWLRNVIPVGIVGTAAFTICSQPAAAFFPPVSNTPNRVTVVPPVSPPPIVVPPVVPPVSPPPFVPPTVPPTHCTCPPVVNPPNRVPEPGTLALAGIGLAAAALGRRVRKEETKSGND
jgi:PEP-CTERM motif